MNILGAIIGGLIGMVVAVAFILLLGMFVKDVVSLSVIGFFTGFVCGSTGVMIGMNR